MRGGPTGWPIESKVGMGFGLALLILLLIGVFSYRSIQIQTETANWVAQIQHVLSHLSDLDSQVNDIETGARGYVITLQEPYLEPFYRGTARVYDTIHELKELTAGNAGQQKRLSRLQELVDERIVVARRVVELRRNEGFDAAVRMIQAGRGKQLTDEVHLVINEASDSERSQLSQRELDAKAGAQRTFTTLVAGGILSALILSGAGYILFRDLSAKRKTEQALQKANEELQYSLTRLERHTQDVSRMSELVDLLHSCQTVEEAYRVIADSMPRMIPDAAGSLGIINASRNFVEIVVSWGKPDLGDTVFSPEDCWALRRGRISSVAGPDSPTYCRHLGQAKPFAYSCIPLMAHGEALGLMHVQRACPVIPKDSDAWMSYDERRFAGTVGDQIALAVSNLRLRDALRQQSVRDPLTGLFNRRYMEEFVELEIQRAARSNRGLGVLMVDLDHFKVFNDTFGHDAGDTMLRELSSVLKKNIRSCDVACRYGGEEFALILLEANLESSVTRAEQLREAVKHVNVQIRGQGMRNLTISAGVAAFPEHGDNLATLLKAADAALYRAKQQGRDRVETACLSELQLDPSGDAGSDPTP